MARKKLARKKMFKNFSAAIFLFVRRRKKSTNSLLGSGINLEKTPVIFVHRISAPRGITLRNIAETETIKTTTTTTGKQSSLFPN